MAAVAVAVAGGERGVAVGAEGARVAVVRPSRPDGCCPPAPEGGVAVVEAAVGVELPGEGAAARLWDEGVGVDSLPGVSLLGGRRGALAVKHVL